MGITVYHTYLVISWSSCCVFIWRNFIPIMTTTIWEFTNDVAKGTVFFFYTKLTTIEAKYMLGNVGICAVIYTSKGNFIDALSNSFIYFVVWLLDRKICLFSYHNSTNLFKNTLFDSFTFTFKLQFSTVSYIHQLFHIFC